MKRFLSTSELTTMALLAALLCVSSYIMIPLPFSPVPITAQTLVITLIALLFRPGKAVIPIVVWILLGIAGVNVFAGGKSGYQTIAGPTGGFIIGFLVAAICISFVCANKNKLARNLVAAIVVGIPVIYAIGIPWMAFVTNMNAKEAMIAGCIPFIPGDIFKCVVAALIARALYGVVNGQRSRSIVVNE